MAFTIVSRAPPEIWITAKARRDGCPVTTAEVRNQYRSPSDEITVKMLEVLVRNRRLRKVVDDDGSIIGWEGVS